jgi:hypothetical protein
MPHTPAEPSRQRDRLAAAFGAAFSPGLRRRKRPRRSSILPEPPRPTPPEPKPKPTRSGR